jgi:(E)-4-hydroxy-3-methylbut-2-enyl-diphosphate synthase
MPTAKQYCTSRFKSVRRASRVIRVGHLEIGGNNPLRVQSMTTTPTQDVAATVKQTLALAEAGCEIVRITAPNKKAAEALGAITQELRAAKCEVPLVADIHFLPSAAMEAAKHVEKVRINPGNYADKKKFAVKEYSDTAYEEELGRLHEAFSPIVLRCKEYGRAMRIGTNHGSLSDRIMNRYGDTPLGMVESALEFIRIAEDHGFHDICLSMKASNPKVMIEAYRLAVARMDAANMQYPLHLGVTEAGDGEDARVKSAIGIGSLLYDGLGDTIRVSLTEDPIHEIPVAQDLANKAMQLWQDNKREELIDTTVESIDPYRYERRASQTLSLSPKCTIGSESVPAVIVATHHPITECDTIIKDVCRTQTSQKDSQIEGLLLKVNSVEELSALSTLYAALESVIACFVLELGGAIDLSDLESFEWPEGDLCGITLSQSLSAEDSYYAGQVLGFCQKKGFNFALACNASDLESGLAEQLKSLNRVGLIVSCDLKGDTRMHPLGAYRAMAQFLETDFSGVPLWIRNTKTASLEGKDYYGDRLLESSILSGALLCDGFGDAISIETEPTLERATSLAYNILQGARARISKTEFVACPSCGRTLFDLQEVTQAIRARTNHLKGVTIAIMGCIVNGPGEMADADFGYVGGAPDKINLYVGRDCVEYNVPANEALERLIELIKSHGKWVEPT